jgi:hypothetical protein
MSPWLNYIILGHADGHILRVYNEGIAVDQVLAEIGRRLGTLLRLRGWSFGWYGVTGWHHPRLD